jgi:cell division protein FtsB
MSKSSENSTVKFLIYVLIFLISVLALLIFLVIPSIKSYKLNRSELKTFNEKSQYLSEKEIELKKSIKNFKDENKKLIKIFDNQFDEKDFIQYSNKYLKNIKLFKVKDSSDKSFDEYTFSASTTTKSPKEFFEFIKNLKNYKNTIKINFPISLISKPNKIDLNFNIGVYKNDKK